MLGVANFYPGSGLLLVAQLCSVWPCRLIIYLPWLDPAALLRCANVVRPLLSVTVCFYQLWNAEVWTMVYPLVQTAQANTVSVLQTPCFEYPVSMFCYLVLMYWFPVFYTGDLTETVRNLATRTVRTMQRYNRTQTFPKHNFIHMLRKKKQLRLLSSCMVFHLTFGGRPQLVPVPDWHLLSWLPIRLYHKWRRGVYRLNTPKQRHDV